MHTRLFVWFWVCVGGILSTSLHTPCCAQGYVCVYVYMLYACTYAGCVCVGVQAYTYAYTEVCVCACVWYAYTHIRGRVCVGVYMCARMYTSVCEVLCVQGRVRWYLPAYSSTEQTDVYVRVRVYTRTRTRLF